MVLVLALLNGILARHVGCLDRLALLLLKTLDHFNFIIINQSLINNFIWYL